MRSRSCRMLIGVFFFVVSSIATPIVQPEWERITSTTTDRYEIGDYQEAEKHWLSELKKAELSGDQAQRVALSLSNLAEIYDAQGQYDKAEPLKQRALAIWEQIVGPEHPDIATSLNNLAVTHHHQAQYAAAKLLYQHALAIREQTQGSEHPATARILHNLAALFHDLEQYGKAKILYQRALTIREQTLDLEDPEISQTLNDLAALYGAQGEYAEAELLFQRALAIRENTLGHEHPDVATSLHNLAVLNYDQDLYAEAELLYQRALDIREKILGLEHPDVAQSLTGLAAIYRHQERYAEARQLYMRALTIQEKILEPEHPKLATILDDLALFYWSQGHYTKAEQLYLRALAIREKIPGPAHWHIMISLQYLIALYQDLGEFTEADRLLQRMQEILEKVSGSEQPDALVNYFGNNDIFPQTSTNTQSDNLYLKAKPYYQRGPAMREETLGLEQLEKPRYFLPENESTLQIKSEPRHQVRPAMREQAESLERPNAVQNPYDHDRYVKTESHYQGPPAPGGKNLDPRRLDAASDLNEGAISHHDKGQYAKAKQLYKQALAIHEKNLGSGHLEVALSLNNLAALYVDQGQYTAAEPLYLRALEIRKKSLGPEHPDVAISLNNLAGLKVRQGQYRQAEQLYQRALGIRERSLHSQHPDIARSLNDLAVLYVDQGQYTRAKPLFQRTLAIWEQTSGAEHPDFAQSLNSLAVLYHQQGQYAKAKPLYERALAIRKETLDPNHPELAQSLNNLAVLHQDQDQNAEAEPLHLRALTLWKKALGPEHPNTAMSLNNLARLYHDQDSYAKAQPLYERALAIREKALGYRHTDTALSLQGLAVIYQDQGQYTKAEPLHQQALVILEKNLGSRHPNVATSLSKLADLYRAKGQYSKALTFSERAIAIYRDRLIPVTEDLSEGSLHERISKSFIFLNHIGLIAGVIEKQPKRRPGLISEAFEAGQLAHTAGTAQAIAQMAMRSAAGNPELSRLIRSHQDTINQWRALNSARLKRLQSSKQGHTPSDDTENMLHARLALLKNRIVTIKKKLHQQFPKYSELKDPQPVALAETQQMLDSDEALLVYLVGKKESYLWVVRKDGAAMHRLDTNAESLTQAVTKLRGAIDTPISKLRTDLRPFNLKLAHRLYEQIIAPAESSLKGIRHIFVMADNALQSLPLAVLITEQPRTTFVFPERYAQLPWLGKKYAFTTLPAVNSLRVLRRFAKPTSARTPLIGFGAPALQGIPETPNKLAYARNFRGRLSEIGLLLQMPPLPETERELKEMARYLKAKDDALYLGRRATESHLKSLDLTSARIIAFSTHGLLAPETKSLLDQAEAALVLTPPEEATKLDDGLLTTSEIAQLKLDADWVILSACNTAAPAAEKGDGDGLSGIAKAFFYAGARSLLVSHWNVESSATSKLMIGMFKELANNPKMRRAEALQKSMLNLLADKENPHYAHPLFWAPFVVVGEGGAIAAR